MQAISVKLVSPTNTRGYRLKAECAAGTLTVERDYSLDMSEDARNVADALMKKLDWSYVKITGQGTLANGMYVFTLGVEK